MGQGADRFRAFVSYAHADAARAGRLQRRLETYRIPDTLGETLDLEGARSGSIGPIFRDREDLSAAADLSEAVRDALAASQALVVVCTPATPKSRWVDREIELFRQLHPDRPVLAALFAGEPAEAFPPALTAGGIEPLAADFRATGDGAKLAFLKVVAGILQVPLDRLIQRDAQRRVRRVTAVTAASLVLVLLMGAMTIFALQSRNEAQRQRGEAEGLIEFMLTDLRTELRGVGRLDVMDGVNERALEYYQREGDLSDFSDDSLERRARVLHAMGEDEFARFEPDTEQAEGYFAEAYRTTSSLLRRTPGSPDRLFEHAQSSYWLGYAHYLQRNWGQAEEYWGEYRDLAEQGLASFSDDGRWRLEAGYANGSLCTLVLHRDDVEGEYARTCKLALDHVQVAAAADPDDPGLASALANRHGWMGDALKRSTSLEAAIRSYEQQHVISERLFLAEPDNAQRVDQLVRAKLVLAEALAANGEREASEQVRAEALPMAREMVERDPENRQWREWLERFEKIN